MILASSDIRRLGVDEAAAVLLFGEEPKAGAWRGRRLLWLNGKAAFELTFWCGTCPVMFQRLEGATGTLSTAELDAKLRQGLSGIDSGVVARLRRSAVCRRLYADAASGDAPARDAGGGG